MVAASFNTLPYEVQELVGNHLSPRELAVCTCVCQAWRAVFDPILWSHIDIDFDNIKKEGSALPGALKAHGAHIRSIRLSCPYDKYESPRTFWTYCPPTFPQLDSMHIIGQCSVYWELLPLYCPPSSLVKWKKLVFSMNCYAGSNTVYGKHFFYTLCRHAPTLEIFRLNWRSFAQGAGVNQLLSLARNLRELYILSDRRDFKDGFLDAREIVKTDWVCAGLEIFVCRIRNIPRPDITRDIGSSLGRDRVRRGTSQESIELQHQVYSKLAQFTRLRELRLGFPVNSRASYSKHRRGDKENYRQHDCLAMTLESGLDLLRDLKDLRSVGLEDMEVYINGDKEQTWFAEHWPLATIGYEDYHTDSDATTISRDSDEPYTDTTFDDDSDTDEEDEPENDSQNEE